MNSDELRKLFRQKLSVNPSLRSLMKRIQSGRATFKDTAEYSRICSEILGKCLSENVLSLTDREAIAADMLRDSYSETNAVLGQVQRSIDKKNGLNIRPQTAVFPLERVQQFTHSLVDPTVPDETIQRRAGSGAANISMSFHDDYMEENAKFRSKAGLLCYIDRETDGNCCKWCTAMAGRYVYGEEPHDVYRRHDNCGCTVVYENGRQRQNVWTKRKSDPEYDREYFRERDRIKAAERQHRRQLGQNYKAPIRLNASQSRALQSHMTVYTQEQARQLNEEKLSGIYGLHSIKGKKNKFEPSVNMDCVSGSKPISEQLQRELSSEYDRFIELFGELGNVRVVTAVPYGSNGVWGAFNDNSNELFLFGIGGDNGRTVMAKTAKKNGSKGLWSTESPYHAYRHELGHAWQKKAAKQDSLYDKKIEKISKIRDDINDNINKFLTDNSDSDIIKLRKGFLSDYGLDPDNDIDEFISECIAEYCDGSPRETSRSVINILFAKEL